jgi:hypothetical protein
VGEGHVGVLAIGAMLALASCLSTFAPTIAARREHAAVRRTSPSTECMRCHVAEREAAAHHGDVPVVATWMLEDRRGCLGCHGVRGAP